MKPVLVKKAYLPTLGESDLTLDDITSLRWIPSYRRNSFNMQQPVRRNISNIDWETRLMGEEGKKPLPGFAEGRNLTGYFLNPAVQMGALHGDVTFNDKGTLMGIAEKPHFWRTPQQGAANMSIAGEGFRYNQLPKEAFVDLQANYSPRTAQSALEAWVDGQRIQGKKASESFDDLATSFPEVYDIASILPDTRTENIWGQPSVLTQNPLPDFDASQYKVASEPMDIAMRLLKEESQGQLYNEDLFEDFLGADDLIHYDEMNDKQRAIIDAKMTLPPHLFTEGSEIGEYMNPFLFSRSMHNKIPDYHYDDELEYLQHYKDAMESGNFVNDNEKTRLLDGNESHPEHPHSVAMSRMHPDFKNRIGTINRLYKASEPMDIAMRLLKQRDRIYDPLNEGIGEEGVDFHPGDEGVDWDSAVSSSLYPGHDLEQRHPNDPDMQEYDRHAQELLGLMVNRDIAHLQGNEKPMTENKQFDLMDARQKLQASIPKNTHFSSIQNAVGYDKDGNKTSTFGDGRPKFNEGSPRYQELIGDRPTVPIHTEGSFYGVPFNEETGFTRSEPMDIAMRLLKMPLIPESVKRVSDNRAEAQFQDPITNQVYPMVAEKDPKFRTMNVGIYPNQPGQNLGAPSGLDAMDMTDKDIDEDVKEMLGLGLSNAELTETNEDNPYYESDMTWTDPEKRRRGYASALYDLVNQLGEQKVRPSDNQSYEGKQLWSKRMLPKGEPMDIAFQLLKERVSPEAKRHKLEYDKKYESSPERVKYREDLNRERRRRHIMGQGGPDMSHTSQHTIVPEDPHTNRARHFKDKGTLL